MTINVRGIKNILGSLESYFKANDIHIAGIGAKVCVCGGGGLVVLHPPPEFENIFF